MTLKRIRFERPRDGVAMDRFRDVWENEHAPRMAKRTQALRYLGTFFEPFDGEAPPYEHAVSLWYRDAEHQRQAYAAPRDPSDPILTVMGSEGVLMETIEYPFREAPEHGLDQTWYLMPRGAARPDGELSDRWQRGIDDALGALEAAARPVRCVASVVTAASTSQEFAGVVEFGWASPRDREAGHAVFSNLESRLVAGAVRFVVGDQVAIIGDLSQPSPH